MSLLYYFKVSLSLLLVIIFAKAQAQLIQLERDGNVGVNFGGFKASAGLGGLLNGDLAKGGLHAEAGTPYGQAAAAGLGGNIEDDGTSKGGLYAGATAGGNVGASAGLSGLASRTHSTGQLGGVASAGSTTLLKTINTESAAPSPNVGGENIQKVSIQATGIEKTKINPVLVPEPVYYVHKTRVRRPHFRKQVYFNTGFNTNLNGYNNQEVIPEAQKVKIVERTYTPAPVIVHKYVAPAPVVTKFVNTGPVVPSNSASVTYHKSVNGNLFNDIFNIPISALQAVNQLVNNIATGGYTATKHITVNADTQIKHSI